LSPVGTALLAAFVAQTATDGSRYREYVSDEGGFAVTLPGVPVVSNTKDPSGETQYRLMLDMYDGAYLVFFEDDPDLAQLSEPVLHDVLLREMTILAKMVEGEVVEHRFITSGDNGVGLAFDAEMQDPPGLFRSRLYLVGDRLYRLTAVGDLEFTLAEPAEAFLSSFRLVSREER